MERLLELDWLAESRDLIITGACGFGKTYIGCALGNLACESFLSVRHYRTQMLLAQLKECRLTDTYLKTMKILNKIDLLIIDDLGLMELSSEQCIDLFEIIEGRHERASTMILSQFPVSKWYDLFSNATYADAILDRLVYHAYKAILPLLMNSPKINKALKQVDIGKDKTQAYAYVKKMQKYAKELYKKNTSNYLTVAGYSLSVHCFLYPTIVLG